MVDIMREAQRLATSAYLELFRFDASPLGGPVMYFTQNAHSDRTLKFGGIDYTPVDVEFSGMETTVSGSLPRPRIKVAGSNGVFHSIINTFGDLQRCSLQRIRTFARFLDDGESPDATQYIGPDSFRVARKVLDTKAYIEWELAANIDQQGKQLPGRQVIRDTCLWRYRQYIAGTRQFDYSKVQCPYTGGAYFDQSGNATDLPNDRCGRKVSDCELRFGKGQRLPFGGFPGIARVRG